MTRDDLVGVWRCNQTGGAYQLNADGSCFIRTTAPDGQSYEEKSEWEYVDAAHWKLRLIILPDPQSPGLEDGAIEVIAYKITSESPRRMTLTQFDVEISWEWEKIA